MWEKFYYITWPNPGFLKIKINLIYVHSARHYTYSIICILLTRYSCSSKITSNVICIILFCTFFIFFNKCVHYLTWSVVRVSTSKFSLSHISELVDAYLPKILFIHFFAILRFFFFEDMCHDVLHFYLSNIYNHNSCNAD